MGYALLYYTSYMLAGALVIYLVMDVILWHSKSEKAVYWILIVFFCVQTFMPEPKQPRQSYVDSLWLQHIPIKDWK